MLGEFYEWWHFLEYISINQGNNAMLEFERQSTGEIIEKKIVK